MFYITGDTHRDFGNVAVFCKRMKTTKEDVMIVLGDAGINFHGGFLDRLKKQELERYIKWQPLPEIQLREDEKE